jgi:hypothetical protein
MSKRARPRRGEWRPPRPRIEIFKAGAAAVLILGGTAGIIYLWPTGSSGGSTPVTVSTSTPTTIAGGATTTTAAGATTLPPGSTTTTGAATTTTKAGAAP